MKRYLKNLCKTSFILPFLMLCSCGENGQDNSPLTMFVGLGAPNQTYIEQIHDAILENTGVDVKCIWFNTSDTSTAINLRLKNYDLPADIVMTSSRTKDEYQKNSFLDLAKYTNVTDNFKVTVLNDCLLDGGIYQLPFASRLIGITYNETLLKEHEDWKIPSNYNEFVDLKNKVSNAGYKFAVTAGAATGHGFNYLFHFMGADYLSVPEGNDWYKSFMKGDTDVAQFEEKAAYFERIVKDGIFDSFHDQNWDASTEFKQTRSLFYFNIINDAYSYDGPRYDEDGKLKGASYNGDEVVAIENENGDFVNYKDEYVYYDSSNAKYEGLKRYTIPGVEILHDTYATMPWINENGSSSCFTSYNNLYIGVDKSLSSSEKSKKLENASKVLTFLTTNEASNIFSNITKDGYVSTKNFKIDETRTYKNYADRIINGYLQPWYYNDFDLNSIVSVGEIVNKFIKTKGEEVSIHDICQKLEECRDLNLSSNPEYIANIEDEFTFEQTAKLQAIANGLSIQNNTSEVITASILPYTNYLDILPICEPLPVVQEHYHKGELSSAETKAFIASNTAYPVAFKLTGKEIKDIVSKGFSAKEDYGIDLHFDFEIVIKNNAELKDNEVYGVAINEKALNSSYVKTLRDNGKEITDFSSKPSTEEGFKLYASRQYNISSSTLEWK